MAIVKDGRVLAIGPPRELGVGALPLPRRLPRPPTASWSSSETDDPTSAAARADRPRRWRAGSGLEELCVGRPTLEDVYLELTADA